MYTGVVFILPEIIISVMACVVLIFDLFVSSSKRYFIYYLSQFSLILTILSLVYLLNEPKCVLFYGAFVFDIFSVFLKFIIIIVMIIIFIYSKKYMAYINLFNGEYFVLCLMSVLGMMIMISSGTFLTLYLGLELLSLPIYSLIIMNRDSISSEASMKYFIMGSIASGIFLFGISLVYGVTGTIELNLVNKVIVEEEVFSNITLKYGLVFIMAGLVFKFGAVPFHMWVPDVYEGSPIPVTLFIGTIPKIAALGMAYRLLSDTFLSISSELELLFIIIGVLSLFIGNIFAISQVDIKRMLAYSAIAHIGFIFFGFLVSDAHDFSFVTFYITVYILSTLGIFGCVLALSTKIREANLIKDFSHLGIEYPILGIVMVILLLSLAGVPPTVGFYAKFFILKNLVSYGYIELAVFAVLMSVIGAFYYLKVIKTMFFESSHVKNEINVNGMSKLGFYIIYLNGLFILLTGIFPYWMLKLCIYGMN